MMESEQYEALAALDMEWARRRMPTASSDSVRLAAMHKARYDCTIIAPELRHASAQWLRERFMHDMSGNDILPVGELP